MNQYGSGHSSQTIPMPLPWGLVPNDLRDLRRAGNDLLWQALVIRRAYQTNPTQPINLTLPTTSSSAPPYPFLDQESCASASPHSNGRSSHSHSPHPQTPQLVQVVYFLPTPGKVALVNLAADRLVAFMNIVNSMEDRNRQLARYRAELGPYVHALQNAIQAGIRYS